MLELVLRNKGTAHTLIDEPELSINAGSVTRILKAAQLKGLDGENILAGNRRRFFIPWPQGLPDVRLLVQIKYKPLR